MWWYVWCSGLILMICPTSNFSLNFSTTSCTVPCHIPVTCILESSRHLASMMSPSPVKETLGRCSRDRVPACREQGKKWWRALPYDKARRTLSGSLSFRATQLSSLNRDDQKPNHKMGPIGLHRSWLWCHFFHRSISPLCGSHQSTQSFTSATWTRSCLCRSSLSHCCHIPQRQGPSSTSWMDQQSCSGALFYFLPKLVQWQACVFNYNLTSSVDYITLKYNDFC